MQISPSSAAFGGVEILTAAQVDLRTGPAKTPVRVMHSRSLATREKRVLRLADDDNPAVRRPGAGYLGRNVYQGGRGYPRAPSRSAPHLPCPRRFVHGDLRRTEHASASLADDADISQLDV